MWNVNFNSAGGYWNVFYRINRNIVECKWNHSSTLFLPISRINRNIVECKLSCPSMLNKSRIGINRNIVECKYNIFRWTRESYSVLIETLWNVNTCGSLHFSIHQFGINRNIVECKYDLTVFKLFQCAVLIETLWNVNFWLILMIMNSQKVLIETLWNVNCLSPFLTSSLSLY